MSAPVNLECCTSVHRYAGRPRVLCEVLHFVASGLTVADMLAVVRPQLETALRAAAALAVEAGPARRPLALRVDIGDADPEIAIMVYEPAAVLADLDRYMGKLLVAVPQYMASSMSPGGAA
jgi:hypothetical protein